MVINFEETKSVVLIITGVITAVSTLIANWQNMRSHKKQRTIETKVDEVHELTNGHMAGIKTELALSRQEFIEATKTIQRLETERMALTKDLVSASTIAQLVEKNNS